MKADLLLERIGDGVQLFRIRYPGRYFEELADLGPLFGEGIGGRKVLRLRGTEALFALLTLPFKDEEQVLVRGPDSCWESWDWRSLAERADLCRWKGPEKDARWVDVEEPAPGSAGPAVPPGGGGRAARRRWPIRLVLSGAAMLAAGFAWNVLFAGIPYQDPPSWLAERYEWHSRFSAVLWWAGAAVLAAGSLALFICRSRGRGKGCCGGSCRPRRDLPRG